MKAIIIDNKKNDIAVSQLNDHLEKKNWNPVLKFYAAGNDDQIIEDIIIPSEGGTLVILDVALTEDEEQRIEGIEESEALMGFSGLRLLHKIKEISPDTVVCMYSKNPDGAVAIAARALRADGFASKRRPLEAANRIDDIARQRLLCNLKFYDALKPCIFPSSKSTNSDIIQAFNGFFLRTSPVRRFGNLCESLKPYVIQMVPDNAKQLMDNLWRRLEDTHALLSLVDKGARDHVKHTGNVFWIGYYILRNVDYFFNVKKNGSPHLEAFIEEDIVSREEQLLLGWVMTALFHDWAYADQKIKTISDLLERIYPGIDIKFKSLDKHALKEIYDPLITHITAIERKESDVKKVLDWMVNNWMESKKLDYSMEPKDVNDHGILSAAYLLKAVGDNISANYKPIFYQAVLAIALHNLENWKKCWSKQGIPKDIRICINKYPLCGLLALADNIQTWEREHENPLEAISQLDIKELVISYVRTGELIDFAVKPSGGIDKKYVLSAKTQYSITHGTQPKVPCRKLREAIETWKSQQHLRRIAETFTLNDIFDVRLTYQIPFVPDINISSEE